MKKPPDNNRASLSRSKFLLLAALFIGPVALALILYLGPGGWRPVGQTQHGNLIDPVRIVSEISLPSASGETGNDFLRRRWSLVFIGGAQCNERCRHALIDMRQVRLALGKDMSRVQRVLLTRGGEPDTEYFETEHSGLIVANAANESGDRILEVIPVYNGVPPEQAGRVYIVDPLGNLMLSYAADSKPSGILKDLKRLLKLSSIG